MRERVVAAVLCSALVSCNLGLDESLIAGDSAVPDATIADTSVAEAEGSVDGLVDALAEPVADQSIVDQSILDQSIETPQTETGGKDVVGDLIEAEAKADSGCAPTADGGACVSCIEKECCPSLTNCRANAQCKSIYNSFVSCETAAPPDATTTNCLQYLEWGPSEAQQLRDCIETECGLCPP